MGGPHDDSFEGPVSTETANENVETSYASERKDYSNPIGKRLLEHMSNSKNDAESAFVTGQSQRSRGGEIEVKSTNNLVEASREEKQQAAVPALVIESKEQSEGIEVESQEQH